MMLLVIHNNLLLKGYPRKEGKNKRSENQEIGLYLTTISHGILTVKFYYKKNNKNRKTVNAYGFLNGYSKLLNTSPKRNTGIYFIC